MSAKMGSAHSKYAGLLPIEPADDFFYQIDLQPEPIDLKPIDPKPEDVPFPYWQPSVERPRSFARLLIAFCTGVAATLLLQSYGDRAREVVANSYTRLGWLSPRPALTTQNPRPHDVVGLAAPLAPSAEKLNATSFGLDAVGQSNSATKIAADREPTLPNTDQIAIGQEQTARNTDHTATNADRTPATKASKITVESQGDRASLQPAARLTEARPPQTLAEKGKPLSATSGQDGSCFASSSAVLQNHPGAWPSWTLKAPGHEGTVCWYAAARPRGSDNQRERTPKEKEAFGTAEHELFAPVASQGRGGLWEGGLP
jgi:hypothetical protein